MCDTSMIYMLISMKLYFKIYYNINKFVMLCVVYKELYYMYILKHNYLNIQIIMTHVNY